MLLLCTTDRSIAGSAATCVAAELAERLRVELPYAADPSPALRSAAHATGCDLVVVGYVARASVAAVSTPGWQRRVVHDAPCPVLLVPAGSSPAPGGGMVLGDDVLELPDQAVATAERLARRLPTPLVVTDVLTGGRASAGSGRSAHRLVRAAAMREAALVVIAGRRRGRALLPRRRLRHGGADGPARSVLLLTPRG